MRRRRTGTEPAVGLVELGRDRHTDIDERTGTDRPLEFGVRFLVSTNKNTIPHFWSPESVPYRSCNMAMARGTQKFVQERERICRYGSGPVGRALLIGLQSEVMAFTGSGAFVCIYIYIFMQ